MVDDDGRWGLVAQAGSLPRRIAALPAAQDFVTSEGFGGVAALGAAIVVAVVAMVAMRRAAMRHRMELEQQERHHQEIREEAQHSAAVARCWQRLVWVVETAGLEPTASETATLGLGPELALELLRGLLGEAERLADDALATAVSVYLSQFSLVLAQQGSSLFELGAASAAVLHAQSDEQSALEKPKAPPPPVTGEPPATTDTVAT